MNFLPGCKIWINLQCKESRGFVILGSKNLVAGAGNENHRNVLFCQQSFHFSESTQQYLVVAPDGSRIEIPKELLGLLLDFLQGSKQTGSVVIQFRNRGSQGWKR